MFQHGRLEDMIEATNDSHILRTSHAARTQMVITAELA